MKILLLSGLFELLVPQHFTFLVEKHLALLLPVFDLVKVLLVAVQKPCLPIGVLIRFLGRLIVHLSELLSAFDREVELLDLCDKLFVDHLVVIVD